MRPSALIAGLLLATTLPLGCADAPTKAKNGVELSELDGVDYTLQLEMVLPENQPDALSDVVSLALVVNNGDGARIEAMTWDVLDNMEAQPATQLPALTNAWLTLVGTDAAGEHVAVGKVGPITATTGLISLAIPMSRPNAFAWLSDLEEGLHGSAVAAAGDGVFYVFGGSTRQAGADTGGVDTVWKVNFTSAAGAPTLARVGEMPPLRDDHEGRAGHSITRLPDSAGAYAGWFLGVGGVANYGGSDNYASTEMFLYNPADNSTIPVPNGSGGSAALSNERFYHQAVVAPNGLVYFVGGLQTSNPVVPVQAVEVYDPASGAVNRFSGSFTAFSGFGMVAAALPDSTLVVCGGSEGGRADGGFLVDMLVQSACNLLDPAALTVSTIDPMPGPAVHGAMIALSDGSLLMSGGIPGVDDGSGDFYAPISGDPTPATTAVYRYKDGAWSIAGDMRLPRAGHQMVALPDGRVLIWGGTVDPEDSFWGGRGGLAWAETFNPADGTSAFLDPSCEAGGCDEADSEGDLPEAVSFPAMAVDPSYGVLSVGGINHSDGVATGVALYRFDENP